METITGPDDPKCPKCNSPIQRGGRGRPRVYCSDVCRRTGELEARRLQARLQRLEDELELARRDRAGYFDAFGNSAADRKTHLASEIASAETRLRVLLGGK